MPELRSVHSQQLLLAIFFLFGVSIVASSDIAAQPPADKVPAQSGSSPGTFEIYPVSSNRPVTSKTFSAELESTLLSVSPQTGTAVQHHIKHLRRIYRDREFQPLWIGANGLTESGQEYLREIGASNTDGIPTKAVSYAAAESSCKAERWAECEVNLTASMLRYATILQYGWLAGNDADWHIEDDARIESSDIEGFEERLSAHSFFKSHRPLRPQYDALRNALAEHRQIVDSGGWPQLPAGLPALRAGERNESVALLRNRLRSSGDFTAYMQADPYYFSPQLARALQSFQKRHGLLADGLLEATTVNALNVSAEDRVRQLELALERWRWLPQAIQARHIWVNLVGGYLQLFEQHEKTLELKAIAGRPYRATPSLYSQLNRLQLNPEWTVPRRIAVEDLLPLQQQNPNFFRSKNIEVFRGRGAQQKKVDPGEVDWKKLNANHFPYWLRQKPGADNSMGKVKFFINNPFDIFLHDTPAATLFNLPGRTFSSGCIRLDKPLSLANAILGKESENLAGLLDTGRTKNLRVAQSVPSYLVYMTSWLDDEGLVQFRTDVYGRDAVLNEAFTNAMQAQAAD